MEFYPIFCLRCQISWISKVVSEPCIYCGSRRTMDYKREVLEDKDNVVEQKEEETGKE